MTAKQQRIELKGSPIVPGIGIGAIYHHHDLMSREFAVYDVAPDQFESEIERVNHAVKRVHQELDELRTTVRETVGASQAEIFSAQKMMLDGMKIPENFAEELRKRKINSEQIVRDLFRSWENRFLEGEGEMLQERAKDIADLGSRLLRQLLRSEIHPLAHIDQPSILFAERLLPSDTVHFDTEQVVGIATAEGGRNSHAAILARALDIPMVSNLNESFAMKEGASTALIDGEKGVVILQPDAQEVAGYQERDRKNRQDARARIEKVKNTALAFDGRKIRIKASATNVKQIERAMAAGAEGIGLFRLEALYMKHSKVPDKEWLFEQLEACCAASGNAPFTIRLLDIGADKELPYLPLARETNPALGIRGIRYLLRHESLLRTQLRVCLRLSRDHTIRILIPMVSLVDDVAAVRRILNEEADAAGHSTPGIAVGAMIETPAAVLSLDALLEEVDFVNIGTNDLIQYTMAVDRDSTELEHYYTAGETLVLNWIFEIARKARAAGLECKICGNLAKNLDRVGDLVSGGIDLFCVVPSFIPVLKEGISDFLDGHHNAGEQ
jgi:phosphotransferase system enzyme I (PtsI)